MLFRLNLAIFLSLVAASTVGIYLLYEQAANDELSRARTNYEETRTSLAVLDDEESQLQTEVMALQNHVESVELRAREQYRLIVPGEHVAMIRN